MARITTDPNYSSPTFPRATAGTDLFVKEDVQALAAAVSTHDHSTGKGVALTGGSIPNGTITSAMIADATIDTADLKDGSVTSAKILDGTIQTVDHADASVTNAKLASDTARANLLCNGGLELWQRGVGPYSSNAFTADRWAIGLSAIGLSVSADSVNVDTASQRAAAVTATGSGAASSFYQTLKTSDESLAGRVVSFSVRVKTSTASAVSAVIAGDVTGATSSGSHTGGGTWQTLTATATVNTNATSVLLVVSFSAACTAYVDNAMLVVGSQPADYAPLHPADDLARCLRYYEIIGETASEFQLGGYGSAASTVVQQPMTYKARKAVSPTVTIATGWGLGGTATQPTVSGAGVSALSFQTVTTGAGMAYLSNPAKGFTVESNP